MYIILATNIEGLKEKKVAAKDGEISIAVMEIELEKENPTFYAFRQGMLYNPIDFKPNIEGNHKLPEKLVDEYHSLMPEARKQLKKLQAHREQKGSNTKEVDELKQSIERKRDRITSMSEQMQTMNDRINILKDENSALSEALDHAKKNSGENSQVEELAKMIETLKKIQSNRIEIKIGEKSTKIIEKAVHEKFSTIIQLLTKNQAVYMYGQAGTGKSELAKQIAEALELPFFPASTITQEFKLTGYQDANGVYRETNFYKAMKYGGVFFLDEMDSSASEVMVGINGALANGYFDFPHETVFAHENFRVIGAGNTIGRGGDMAYTGRSVLDISTLDRFWALEIDYSPAIEYAIAGGDMELIEFSRAVRKSAEENGIIILLSYRSMGRLKNFQNMFPLVEIMEMAVVKGIASDDIDMLVRNMNIDTNNKYFQALQQVA